MKLLARLAISLVVCAWISVLGASAQGQPTQSDGPALPAEITVEYLQGERKAAENDADIDETQKKEISEIYLAATDELKRFQSAKESIARLSAEIESAPGDTEDAKTRRASMSETTDDSKPIAATPLAGLERQLTKASEQFDAATTRLAELDAEPKRRTDRLTEIPAQLRDLKAKLEAVDKVLAEDSEPGPIGRARRILSSVQKASWTASIAAMEKERLAYEATEELLRLDREIGSAKSSQSKTRVEQLQTLVNEGRKAEAEQQARAAREAATTADPAISALAQHIADLAQKRPLLADQMALASRELQDVRTTVSSVQKGFRGAKGRVEAGGLSEAAGNVLRQERKRLPNTAEHQRNMRSRKDLISDVRFSLYDLEDQALILAATGTQGHPDAARHRILKRLGMTQTTEPEVRRLLEEEHRIVDQLIADYNDYLGTLIDLDSAEQQLVDTTVAYSKFISERVLWIRSTHPLGRRDLRPALDAAAWIGSPTNWMDAGLTLVVDIRGNWTTWSIFAIVFLIILFFQRRLRLYINDMGARVVKGTFAQFLPTLATFVATMLISIPWPLLLALVGIRLRASLSELQFTTALSASLVVVACCWFPIEFLRQTIRKGGLADAHFGWTPNGIVVVRAQLRWLRYLGLPLLLVVALTTPQTRESLWTDSLGRAAFVCLMLLVAYVLSRVFHPSKGALSEWSAWRRTGWFYRFRYLWLAAVAGGPVVMVALAVTGYYETAQTIAIHLWATLCWVVGLMVLRSLLARWVLMNRRKIALEQWRQRRQKTIEKEESGDLSAVTVAPEPEVVDLAVVSGQTLKLIDTAILTLGIVLGWLIWIDVLPALGILRGVPVWPGATTPTLADILLAIATLMVTYIAANNIPGLLELGVLEFTDLDAGARYAISTLTRYALVIVGLSMAGTFLGITWSSIQWLVAAVGIGLGFGLQEIFANFVSGIVLLFEQPLRMGDVVSVGETTGVVTRIRIRATTITDWDKKEYVVPNKDLITGTLLNWTLSNQTSRVVINIGVAYGADTELARELLVKTAAAHPHVLDDPAPFATFEGFGDSTLNLILRCYIGSIGERLRAINDLHTSIDREFKKADIEIAFPQRDLHIRTMTQPMQTTASASDESTSR